jgi:hypothetical protein
MNLPPTWFDPPLRYHYEQSQLWQSKKKFCVAVAGRGSGKTELARRKIVLSLPIKKPWPDPIYVYALPTFAQAKRVAWRPLLNLIPPRWIKKNGINVSDLSIETVFGSILYVMGMDKPQRIEGIQIDGAVIDESSDQKPGTFNKSILPTLNHRDAWCWRIGVPKRSGVGRIEFRAFYELGIMGDDLIDSFMWKSATILSPEALEQQRTIMDEADFDEQYNAVWLDAGGSIYHAFTEQNVSEDCVYDPSEDILVGADFNVDPMCWTLAHEVGDTIRVFDELFLRNTNTEATLKKLKQRYPFHKNFKFYCDASSRQRNTSASKTDYLIIKNDVELPGKMVYYPDRNPKLQDRFATVNAVLCNAKGKRDLLINPKCKHLINDLRMMAYKEGTTDPEDYTGTDIGHMSDGMGYMIWKLRPMDTPESNAPVVTLDAI